MKIILSFFIALCVFSMLPYIVCLKTRERPLCVLPVCVTVVCLKRERDTHTRRKPHDGLGCHHGSREPHAEHELRVEVPRGRTCALRLLSGLAEVFGTELSPGVVYNFEGPRQFAVFTWYKDCKVELSGVAADAAHMTDDSQMKTYASVHGRLNWKRDEARRVGADGPRVLVCGPANCGKSTMCRVLLAYAVRTGYAPTFVELDVGQGSLSVPGTVGAAVLSPREITPDRGVTAARPLVYWYGEKQTRRRWGARAVQQRRECSGHCR